jgi:hypothetical protein
MGERKGVNRVLVGKPEGKRPLRRSRLRWEDNIKMDLQEVVWGMDWLDLAQNCDRRRAVVKEVMNVRAPQNAGSFLNS